MASLKELRGRIRSVKNTQQITKTMKMVAAAKVRRARLNCEMARPYAERMQDVLKNMAQNTGDNGPLLLTGRQNEHVVRLVIFGSDRGLCGGFNANLMKKTAEIIREWQAIDKTVQLVAVGRKIRDAARSQFPDMLVQQHVDLSRDMTFDTAKEIAEEHVSAFETGECDVLQLIFSECETMLTQTPKNRQLVPFVQEDNAGEAISIDYEPGEEEVLSELLPKNINMQFYQAWLESLASEQAARMTAMDSATRNAGEMIKGLTLVYNRSRQAAITKELIEIISGAEAV